MKTLQGLLFFVLTIFSCSSGVESGAVRDYSGTPLYNGEIIFLNSADMSGLNMKQLSVPFSSISESVLGGNKILSNKEENWSLYEWEIKAMADHRRASNDEKIGVKLQFICDYMELIDLELVELLQKEKIEEFKKLLKEKAGEEEYSKALEFNVELMKNALYLHVTNGKIGGKESDNKRMGKYKYLKENCPKYRQFMDIVEHSKLENIEGKVSNIDDLNSAVEFIKRANVAVTYLPLEKRNGMLADAICQLICKAPDISEIDNILKWSLRENLHIQKFEELDDFIFKRKLKEIGLAKNFQEERLFRKVLMKACPAYDDWVERRYYLYENIAAPSLASIGLSGPLGIDNSFTPPSSIQFDSISQLQNYFVQINKDWKKNAQDMLQKNIRDDERAQWAIQQTCNILENLDLSYAQKDEFGAWHNTASINYKLGVESPQDIKILIYGQMLAFFDSFIKEGQCFNIPDKRGFRNNFKLGYVRNSREVKRVLQSMESCGIWDELDSIVDKNALAISKEFYVPIEKH